MLLFSMYYATINRQSMFMFYKIAPAELDFRSQFIILPSGRAYSTFEILH